MNTSERRRYFRINEMIGLAYRLIEDNTTIETLHAGADVGLTTNQVLRTIDKELNGIINAVWRADPTLAKAIGLINRKIDIIASEMAIALHPLESASVEHEELMVNLSGCGMLFQCKDNFKINDRLELLITLKPSNLKVALVATVIDCEPGLEGRYQVQVNFDIQEQEQEQLIQHIVQRQIQTISSDVDHAEGESEEG
jgi:hypothetical protein